MALIGVAPVILAVKAKLQADLATVLAAIDATLPAPSTADGYHTYLTDPRLLPSYPAIIIRRARPDIDPPQLGGEYHFEWQIAVDVVVTGEGADDVTTKTEAHVLAACQVLTAEPSAPSAYFPATIRGIGWGDPDYTDPETGEYLQDVPILFGIDTYERP